MQKWNKYESFCTNDIQYKQQDKYKLFLAKSQFFVYISVE